MKRLLSFVFGLFLPVSLLFAGIGLTTIGAWTNGFVMQANRGQMPVWCVTDGVLINVVSDPSHSVLTKSTRYPELADIIPVFCIVQNHAVLGQMASIGDLLIFTGGDLSILSPLILLGVLFVLILEGFSLVRRVPVIQEAGEGWSEVD